MYNPPKGVSEPFETFLKEISKKQKNNLNPFYFACDLNVNVLDHDKCGKVDSFLDLLYKNGLILTINKSTRVTIKTAISIDHILTNNFTDVHFKTTIFKTDI